MVAEDFRVFSASFDDIREAVRRALEEFKANSIKWSREDCVVIARSPFNFGTLLTGGQELTIVLNRTSGQVWVQSSSGFRGGLDFGIINRMNCQIILKTTARHLNAIEHKCPTPEANKDE
jgi:hypothetical protein